MDEVYVVFKGFLDPLFIVFVLFFIAFIILFLNCRKKSDTLILLLPIVLIYGARHPARVQLPELRTGKRLYQQSFR